MWSSESSSNNELTAEAKRTFNSFKNKDGSLLKVILGTRSIMEGVSFKNVKQVHITEPWWNEARIEQILARAVRFCSHSQLPFEEQYTDVYKHYSILPDIPNIEIQEFLMGKFNNQNYKEFDTLSIEEKMNKTSLKKLQINLQFENVLKESAYDCQLNKYGNILRLEENIICINSLENLYQIIYKIPITLQYFIREGIPISINKEDIENRTYSYPNVFPTKFYLAKYQDNKYVIDEERISEPLITNDKLNIFENIGCWYNNNTLKDINIEFQDTNNDIREYLLKISENYSNSTLDILKTKILLKQQLNKSIHYNVDKQSINGRSNIIKCINKLLKSDKVNDKLKASLNKLNSNKDKFNKKLEIIKKIQEKSIQFNEEIIYELLLLSIKELNNILKEYEN